MKRSFALNWSLAILAIGAGCVAGVRPWQGYLEQRAETNREVTAMKTYEKRRADLLREEARDSSAVGREQLARKLGYVRPGQRPASH